MLFTSLELTTAGLPKQSNNIVLLNDKVAKLKAIEVIVIDSDTGAKVSSSKVRLYLSLDRVTILENTITEMFDKDSLLTTSMDISNKTEIKAGFEKFLNSDTANYLVVFNFIVE